MSQNIKNVKKHLKNNVPYPRILGLLAFLIPLLFYYLILRAIEHAAKHIRLLGRYKSSFFFNFRYSLLPFSYPETHFREIRRLTYEMGARSTHQHLYAYHSPQKKRSICKKNTHYLRFYAYWKFNFRLSYHIVLNYLSALRQRNRLYWKQTFYQAFCLAGLGSKRLVDVFGSTLALLLLSPVFLVTALCIRLDSKGPIFFRQQRVGKHGKCFKIWKFRSMYFNAEEQKAALKKAHNLEGEVRFKLRYDPRITPVGKIIRKYSLDELPQLWNVFRGEMSLVGPRPPLVCEVLRYNLHQLQRLDIKPGITCIWQVSGRSELPFQKQVELDLEYMTTQSLLGDLILILKTIPAVLKGQGAW